MWDKNFRCHADVMKPKEEMKNPDNWVEVDNTLPDDFENTAEEIEMLDSIDFEHRLWPRCNHYIDDPGEWSAVIIGTEKDFNDVHNLLIENDWLVSDKHEAYVKREST